MRPSLPCLRRCGSTIAAATIVSLNGACAGTDTAGPPAEGALIVTSATAGDAVDPDGYAVSLDGAAARPIGSGGLLTLTGISPGEHRLGLLGIAENCSLDGENPRTAVVSAGDTARVDFSVTCSVPAADVRVITRTIGPNPDPDGYAVGLDRNEPQPIGTQTAITFPDVEPGEHALTLSGLAENCVMDGPNPVGFTIPGAPALGITFRVLCSGIRVSTATTGTDPDLDGYLVAIDGGPPSRLGINGVLEIASAPGAHTVALTGVAANCAASGAHERSVSADSGAAAEVVFEISCRSRIPGPVQLLYWGGPAGHIYRTDGSRSTDLTPRTDGASARWAPDRSKIVFESSRDGSRGIYVMNADGSAPTRITSGSAPVWSPDGNRIAFVRDGLVTAKPDGTDQQRLTNDASDALPAWSPDGTRIAFQRRGTCTLFFFDPICALDLYTVAPDGNDLTRLTQLRPDQAAHDPAWSPDGRRLVYSFGPRLGLPRNLFVLELATGQVVQLTRTAERWEQSPVWSPDGATIAFADSDGDGITQVLRIPAGGGATTRVPTGEGPVYPSSWR